MKNILYVLLILSLFAPSLIAQEHKKANHIDEIRGDVPKRLYEFYIDTIKIGELVSEYEGSARFQGVLAYEFREQLNLDYALLGQENKRELNGRHFVDENNRYIGSDLSIISNETINKLYILNGDEYLEGYAINNNIEDDILIPLGQNYATLDNLMFDQYELFLAGLDFKIGDTITDTVFVPQYVYKTAAQFVVEDYTRIRYGANSDFAFVCHFLSPINMSVYFTKEHKLLRMEMENQNLHAILIESALEKAQQKMTGPSFGIADLLRQLPIYLVYILFGVLIAIPFLRKNYRNKNIYVALVLGALAYQLIKLIIVPIHQWYFAFYLTPALQAGQSIYSAGVVPSVVTGMFYTILKSLPIVLLIFWKKPGKIEAITLGLFCGLGIAIYEACYMTGAVFQAGQLNILSWGVFDRFVYIVFHATSGALIAYYFATDWKKSLLFGLIVMLIHSCGVYFIVFVNTGVIDMPLMQMLAAFYYLLFLLGVYSLLKAQINR